MGQEQRYQPAGIDPGRWGLENFVRHVTIPRFAFLGLIALLPALLILSTSTPAMASDPLTQAKRQLSEGNVQQALAFLEEAHQIPPIRAQALLLSTRILLEQGECTKALQLAQKATGGVGLEAPGRILSARAYLCFGKDTEAVKLLQEALTIDPNSSMAKVILAQTHLLRGRKEQARNILEPMVAADNRGLYTSGEDLLALGMAANLLNSPKFAFQAFEGAVRRDPSLIGAHLERGWVALDKHDLPLAARAFQAALESEPQNPRAKLGMAKVRFGAHGDFEGARQQVEEILKTSANLAQAHLFLAELDLIERDLEPARQRLQSLIADDPSSLEAMALLAAVYSLDEDRKAVRQTLKQIQSINPNLAPAHTTMARIAAQHQQYAKAVKLARKAVKADPDYWPAYLELAINATRIGLEDEGRRYLERYYEHDDYNVRVVNTLNLYERWLNDYLWENDGDLRLRAHKAEMEVLKGHILPFAKELKAHYAKKYKVVLQQPLLIEIFHRPELFAIRSVGLPAVASHGICFGRVITMRSPSEGNFNWAQVIAHEMNHVFVMELSRSRAPRWFAEGLAEYETTLLQPGWQRDQDHELWHNLKSGRLRGVLDLDKSFTRAQSFMEMVTAYHHTSLLVKFMVERWGFAKVRSMLPLYAKGLNTRSVLKEALKVKPAMLDSAFQSWLGAHLNHLDQTWDLDEIAFRNKPDEPSQAKEDPKWGQYLCHMAAHHLVNGQWVEARRWASLCREKDQHNRLGLYSAGISAMALGDKEDAQQALEMLLQTGADGLRLQMALGELKAAMGEREQAESHFRRAMTISPNSKLPNIRTIQSILQRGDTAEAALLVERVINIDRSEPTLPLAAAHFLSGMGDYTTVLDLTALALEISPFLPKPYLLRADALANLNKGAQASKTLEMALLVSSPKERPAIRVRLARILLQAGKKDEALRQAQMALDKAPEVEGAQSIIEMATH